MSDPVMVTKYFPLFYNYRTLSLRRFLGIMAGELYWIKRTSLPVPEFLINLFAYRAIFNAARFLAKNRYKYFYPGAVCIGL
jgi:hypothetical protein